MSAAPKFKEMVELFIEARETCPNYTGIKDNDESLQCTHGDNRGYGNWCAMDCCPLLRAEARTHSVGWD